MLSSSTVFNLSFLLNPCLPSQGPLLPLSVPITHNRRFRRFRGYGNVPSPSHLKPLLAASASLYDEQDLETGFAAEVLVEKKAAEVSSDLKGTSMFLVGMSSKMKTELGKLLANSLRYCFFDSDNLVHEAVGGVSAAKSLKERDEKGFQDTETEVLKQLSSMGRLVVCAGDGAVKCPTNLALLRHGISIWIDVPLDIVAKEMLSEGEHCSSSTLSTSRSHSEVMAHLVELYGDMRDGYSTADATVSLQKVGSSLGYEDLGAVTREQMALEVLSGIQKLIRVKRLMENAARPF